MSYNNMDGPQTKNPDKIPKKSSSGMTKRPSRKKPKDKPKRPLSAYNYFFKQERQRILKYLARDHSAPNPPDEVVDDEQEKRLVTEGGKVSFEEMGKLIGRRWKAISPENLEKYSALAATDAERYKKELADYNDKKEKGQLLEQQNKQMVNARGGVPPGMYGHHGGMGGPPINNHMDAYPPPYGAPSPYGMVPPPYSYGPPPPNYGQGPPPPHMQGPQGGGGGPPPGGPPHAGYGSSGPPPQGPPGGGHPQAAPYGGGYDGYGQGASPGAYGGQPSRSSSGGGREDHLPPSGGQGSSGGGGGGGHPYPSQTSSAQYGDQYGAPPSGDAYGGGGQGGGGGEPGYSGYPPSGGSGGGGGQYGGGGGGQYGGGGGQGGGYGQPMPPQDSHHSSGHSRWN